MKQLPLLLLALAVTLIAALSLSTMPATTAPTTLYPFFIDYGDSMAVGDTHIYYSRAANEAGCAVEEGVYGRVPNGSVAKERLVEACQVPGGGNAMVIDDQHVYYVTTTPQSTTTTLWRHALDGSGESEMLHPSGNISPLALAIDERNVYFAIVESTTQIWAYHRDQGTMTPVAHFPPLIQGEGVHRLVVDDTHLYWTEGDGTVGALRGVEKTGGQFFTRLELADAFFWDLALAGDQIYWTDLTGYVARINQNGCCFEIVDTMNSGAPVLAVDVHDDVVYYSSGDGQNGALWQKPVAGGTAALMAFGGEMGGMRDLAHVAGYLYWTNGGLYRLDENAVSDGVDYVLERMEVTQGIQDGFNSVPLATGKETYVRVYPRESAGNADQEVTARLYGFRNDDTQLPGSPLSPISTVDPDGNGARRADAEETFIFLLPETWVNEQFKLQAKINPAGLQQVFENDYDNNDFPSVAEPMTAADRSACLVTFPVAAVDANGEQTLFPPPQDSLLAALAYVQQMLRAESLFPGVLHAHPQQTILMKTPQFDPWEPFDLTTKVDRDLLNSVLDAVRDNSDPPAGCQEETTLYSGLVSAQAATFDPVENSNYGGFGGFGRMWAKMSINGPTVYNEPIGGRTLAHEMGHAVGRPHVDCGDPPAPGPYDYPPCQLDASDDENAHWGYDGLTGSVISPLVAADLMSYGSPRWISDFNWENIYDAIDPSAGMAAPLDPQDEWILYARGAIDADAARFSPFYQFAQEELTEHGRALLARSQALQGTDTRYALELRAANDVLLYRQPLETELYDAPGHEGIFSTALPYPAGTATILLVDNNSGQTLASRAVSASAPVVSDVQVLLNGDEMTVSWSAQDADGDDLYAIIQYGYGNGRRQAALVDFPASQATLPVQSLSGEDGPARIYVTVSDGVYGAWAMSARFDLPENDPLAVITHPGEPLPAGRAVTLRARSFDPEDGSIAPSAAQWWLDGEEVGSGHWLMLPALPPGEYAVQFQVTDSDGQRTVARTTLTITERDDRLYLPIILGGSEGGGP